MADLFAETGASHYICDAFASIAECNEVTVLYFAKPNRAYTLDLINTYSREVTKRVLPVFDDIEGEAGMEAYNENTYERAYEDLTFVRGQVTGLAISGVYHLWERLLKEFLIDESRHFATPTKDKIRRADFVDLRTFLDEFGWTIENEVFYAELDCLRLISNVIKHGNGKSCEDLLKSAPDMFVDWGHPTLNESRNADDLLLKREDFKRFVSAVQEFFERFPERLPS